VRHDAEAGATGVRLAVFQLCRLLIHTAAEPPMKRVVLEPSLRIDWSRHRCITTGDPSKILEQGKPNRLFNHHLPAAASSNPMKPCWLDVDALASPGRRKLNYTVVIFSPRTTRPRRSQGDHTERQSGHSWSESGFCALERQSEIGITVLRLIDTLTIRLVGMRDSLAVGLFLLSLTQEMNVRGRG
jgi:hypothetical protein